MWGTPPKLGSQLGWARRGSTEQGSSRAEAVWGHDVRRWPRAAWPGARREEACLQEETGSQVRNGLKLTLTGEKTSAGWRHGFWRKGIRECRRHRGNTAKLWGNHERSSAGGVGEGQQQSPPVPWPGDISLQPRPWRRCHSRPRDGSVRHPLCKRDDCRPVTTYMIFPCAAFIDANLKTSRWHK